MTIRDLLLLSPLITWWKPVEPPGNRKVPATRRDTPSSAQNSDSGPVKSALIRGPGFVGVIFPANAQVIQGLYPKGVSYWTPSEAAVLEAEKGLVPFLKGLKDPRIPEIAKGIEKYKRQYRGIILGGQKQISIRFLCEVLPSDDWTRKETIVDDGGSCFFNLRFSTETKTFSHLQINGVA